MPASYVYRICEARVYEIAQRTRLDPCPKLSARLSNTVLLKREDRQTSFSFKVRGAYNRMAHMSAEEREHGVITSSAGNHAQGVALSAAKLECRAVIVMPTTTPQVKVDAVINHGGNWVDVVLFGDSYSDSQQHALDLQRESGMTFIHPFDDPLVIAGQGTIGKELLDQYDQPIDSIFIPIGGGGMISGMGAYIKSVRPEIRIIGVQAADSDAMKRSLDAGHRVDLDDVGLFSDGTAVKKVGEEPFRICQQVVDEIITVDTDAICGAINHVYMDTRTILEPAGALAVAGLKKYVRQGGCTGKTLVAIASGANMNFSRLRFVSQRADVGREREALFAVTIPEERGAFRRLCALVGDHSVTEFNYRIAEKNRAHILVGIETNDEDDGRHLQTAFIDAGLEAIDLSHDELAKTHLRHMVGGRSPLAADERLYRFEFPERPGALMRFLSTIPSKWNISLFHYRSIGADYGDVLVGIQDATDNLTELEAFLARIGYRFRSESENAAYRLFLEGR